MTKDEKKRMLNKAREMQVVKSNELILHTRHNLTAEQQKLLVYVISKIRPDDKDLMPYELDIKEFCEVAGIESDNGKNYQDIKKAIELLAQKSMWLALEPGTLLPDGEKANIGDEALIHWIEHPVLRKRKGKVLIQINPYLKPYLIDLKAKFCEYSLVYALALKSKYSIRIYELCKSVHYKKLEPYTYTITVEELEKRVCSGYKEFKSFNLRVLKPAEREINEKTDINIHFEFVKSSRAVTALKVHITPKSSLESSMIAEQHNVELNGIAMELEGQTGLEDLF